MKRNVGCTRKFSPKTDVGGTTGDMARTLCLKKRAFGYVGLRADASKIYLELRNSGKEKEVFFFPS